MTWLIQIIINIYFLSFLFSPQGGVDESYETSSVRILGIYSPIPGEANLRLLSRKKLFVTVWLWGRLYFVPTWLSNILSFFTFLHYLLFIIFNFSLNGNVCLVIQSLLWEVADIRPAGPGCWKVCRDFVVLFLCAFSSIFSFPCKYYVTITISTSNDYIYSNKIINTTPKFLSIW